MNENSIAKYPESIKVLLPEIREQLDLLVEKDFIRRFNQRDVNLWSTNQKDHEEIAHRLAWLDAAEDSKTLIPEAEALRDGLLSEGYTHAVVLGMGGSSLAPEVYSLLMGHFQPGNNKHLDVSILDSTSPGQIIAKRESLPLDKTLFIVSSKSGTTVEVKTLFAYFWQLIESLDPQQPGKHFVAISDPGTKLQELAAEKKFRKAFQANPDVGGRYSALIAFGLVPAVLAGFDASKLLKASTRLSSAQTGTSLKYDDPGVQLGLILGSAYLSGRDKLTLLADRKTEALGSWIEQLTAESSGKDGRGILPVDKEPIQPIGSYGQDRLFVYLRKDGELDDLVKKLIGAGQPVFTCQIEDVYDLAAEYYHWEVAIAVACVILNVNAFNQPNVQESKDIAKQMVNALKNGSRIETAAPVWKGEGLALFCNSFKAGQCSDVRVYIKEFLTQAKKGDFIGINAFIPRNEKNEKKLQTLRKILTEQTGLATTLGFGPRFLHSTGQLHKGGKNNGIFLVISQDEDQILEIPGEGIKFNNLLYAQALGDTQALEKHQRRVLRLHFLANRFNKIDLAKLIG